MREWDRIFKMADPPQDVDVEQAEWQRLYDLANGNRDAMLSLCIQEKLALTAAFQAQLAERERELREARSDRDYYLRRLYMPATHSDSEETRTFECQRCGWQAKTALIFSSHDCPDSEET